MLHDVSILLEGNIAMDYERIRNQIPEFSCDGITLGDDVSRQAEMLDTFLKRYEENEVKHSKSERITLTISIISAVAAVIAAIVGIIQLV